VVEPSNSPAKTILDDVPVGQQQALSDQKPCSLGFSADLDARGSHLSLSESLPEHSNIRKPGGGVDDLLLPN
jgi:hypothetical protein